jgi:hypothetical protein
MTKKPYNIVDHLVAEAMAQLILRLLSTEFASVILATQRLLDLDLHAIAVQNTADLTKVVQKKIRLQNERQRIISQLLKCSSYEQINKLVNGCKEAALKAEMIKALPDKSDIGKADKEQLLRRNEHAINIFYNHWLDFNDKENLTADIKDYAAKMKEVIAKQNVKFDDCEDDIKKASLDYSFSQIMTEHKITNNNLSVESLTALKQTRTNEIAELKKLIKDKTRTQNEKQQDEEELKTKEDSLAILLKDIEQCTKIEKKFNEMIDNTKESIHKYRNDQNPQHAKMVELLNNLFVNTADPKKILSSIIAYNQRNITIEELTKKFAVVLPQLKQYFVDNHLIPSIEATESIEKMTNMEILNVAGGIVNMIMGAATAVSTIFGTAVISNIASQIIQTIAAVGQSFLTVIRNSANVSYYNDTQSFSAKSPYSLISQNFNFNSQSRPEGFQQWGATFSNSSVYKYAIVERDGKLYCVYYNPATNTWDTANAIQLQTTGEYFNQQNPTLVQAAAALPGVTAAVSIVSTASMLSSVFSFINILNNISIRKQSAFGDARTYNENKERHDDMEKRMETCEKEMTKLQIYNQSYKHIEGSARLFYDKYKDDNIDLDLTVRQMAIHTEKSVIDDIIKAIGVPVDVLLQLTKNRGNIEVEAINPFTHKLQKMPVAIEYISTDNHSHIALRTASDFVDEGYCKIITADFLNKKISLKSDITIVQVLERHKKLTAASDYIDKMREYYEMCNDVTRENGRLTEKHNEAKPSSDERNMLSDKISNNKKFLKKCKAAAYRQYMDMLALNLNVNYEDLKLNYTALKNTPDGANIDKFIRSQYSMRAKYEEEYGVFQRQYLDYFNPRNSDELEKTLGLLKNPVASQCAIISTNQAAVAVPVGFSGRNGNFAPPGIVPEHVPGNILRKLQRKALANSHMLVVFDKLASGKKFSAVWSAFKHGITITPLPDGWRLTNTYQDVNGIIETYALKMVDNKSNGRTIIPTSVINQCKIERKNSAVGAAGLYRNNIKTYAPLKDKGGFVKYLILASVTAVPKKDAENLLTLLDNNDKTTSEKQYNNIITKLKTPSLIDRKKLYGLLGMLYPEYFVTNPDWGKKPHHKITIGDLRFLVDLGHSDAAKLTRQNKILKDASLPPLPEPPPSLAQDGASNVESLIQPNPGQHPTARPPSADSRIQPNPGQHPTARPPSTASLIEPNSRPPSAASLY